MLNTVFIISLIMISSCFTLPKSQIKVNKTARSVYMIIDENGGWGTGFAAKTGSGRLVVVTNDHVCDYLSSSSLLVKGVKRWRAKVVYKSPFHDLCLLAAPSDAVPLKISELKNQHLRQKVYTVGFPAVQYLTSASGQTLGPTDKAMFYNHVPLHMCNSHKYIKSFIELYDEDGKLIKKAVCLFTPSFLMTSIKTDQGGSGSPVLNSNNEVIGVIAISEGRIGFAGIVPLVYLIHALKNN